MENDEERYCLLVHRIDLLAEAVQQCLAVLSSMNQLSVTACQENLDEHERVVKRLAELDQRDQVDFERYKV